MHGFWPIEFSNSRLGASHECGNIVMFGLAFLSASQSHTQGPSKQMTAARNFTTPVFIKSVQDIKMFSICPQHNQSYFKKEFLFRN
jgi:hypothetical protein